MQRDQKLQLADGTPVSEFRMPGVSCRQLAGKLNSPERNSRRSMVLVAAEGDIFEKLTGDAAVFQVPRWGSGNFRINFEAEIRPKTITLNTRGLMEGLRLVDEARRDPGGQSEEEEDVLLDS